MKTNYYFLLCVLFAGLINGCSKDDPVKTETKSVVTGVTSSGGGQYKLLYDDKGLLTKITYAEGGSSYDYTFTWNSDSTQLTKTGKRNGVVSLTSDFYYDGDSLLTKYTFVVPGEADIAYNFGYGNKLINAAEIVRDGVSNMASVETTDVFTTLTFDDFTIGMVYTVTDSPFLLVPQELMAAFIDQELPVYCLVDRREVWSVNDSSESWQINSFEYTVVNGKLMSFSTEHAEYSFTYSDILVKK